MQTGRVLKSTGKWYTVMPHDAREERIMCHLPGKFRLKELKQTNPIAVGDEVDFTRLADGKATIENIHERRSKISRKATHGKKGEHILVSNVDQGFVIQAIRQPVFKTGFIDRFLVSTEAFGIKAFIVLNKADLGSEEQADEIASLIRIYDELGYDIMLTSIYDDESIQELSALMANKTSVFIGPSGTGKTSLLNAMQPGLEHAVGEISTFSNKGKHTTTFAELIPLHNGGFLADTPGIREFGLIHFEPAEIAGYFPEIQTYNSECKFYNCSHLHEPGCAVMEAFHEGKIAPSRYESYINIYESLSDETGSAGSRKR